jgi:hypothetical protein
MKEQLDREGMLSRIGHAVLSRTASLAQRYTALSPLGRFVVMIGVFGLLALAINWGILPSNMGRHLAPAQNVH